MKIWFDTEFIEDGRTIDLISIGMVREDGATLYMENANCQLHLASPWVVENVLPHLTDKSKDGHRWYPKHEIARQVQRFAGERPEFWAYFADYDWVVLCQLFGTMMHLPDGWPMFCMDVQQHRVTQRFDQEPVKMTGKVHNALDDAFWCRDFWRQIESATTTQ